MLNISKDLDANIVRQIERYVNDESRAGHIPQPVFIVGSRGAGKSTLLRMLADRLKDNGLTDRLHLFDGKRFFNSHDIISAIDGVDHDGTLRIADNNGDERRIVLIDDLDYYFKRNSFDSQYLLRNYLNRESAPLLIASISEIDNSLADYRAPFFEGVRLIFIPPLNNSIISDMDASEATKNRLSNIMDYLPPVIESLKVASDIVAVSDNKDNDIKELLNRVASAYRIKLEGLPVYSQKILYSLAMSPKALTLTELRTITGLPAGTLSTYLRQMAKSGDIRKTDSQKRGIPYEIPDSLFKLWLSSQTL